MSIKQTSPKKSSKQVPSTDESARACDLNLKKLSMNCALVVLVHCSMLTLSMRNAPSFNTRSLCSYKYLGAQRIGLGDQE